jgi:hypothetical protein
MTAVALARRLVYKGSRRDRGDAEAVPVFLRSGEPAVMRMTG